ncbi:MAG TPA: hypothetical protein VFH91_05880, partial [Pyrinomonadaceae bacterium]|nr:hypothetical protein [Pyrinomonadaceae bacterium]
PPAKTKLLRQFASDDEIIWRNDAIKDCSKSCLGLPAGTKLYEVDVPAFHLQLAEIEGEMKIVSAMYSYQ